MPGEKATTFDSAFGNERSRGLAALSFEQQGQSVAEPTPVSTTRPVEHEAPPTCPRCHRGDVRRSHSRGPLDALARVLGFRPFRCRACRTRYFVAH